MEAVDLIRFRRRQGREQGMVKRSEPDWWIEVVLTAFQASRQLRKVLAQHTHACQLNDSEFLLLWICGGRREQGVPQADLIGRLGLSAAQLSGLVYDVCDRGWIEMQRPAADRRRQILRLTAAGQLVLERTMTRLQPLVTALESQVTEAEQATCLEFLRHLVAIGADESTEQSGLVAAAAEARAA
jgi:DNA-binding MarR family transcriptional regulator